MTLAMINELHVSLITPLKGVQSEGEGGGERGRALPWPLSLFVEGRAVDDLRAPDVKRNVSKKRRRKKKIAPQSK